MVSDPIFWLARVQRALCVFRRLRVTLKRLNRSTLPIAGFAARNRGAGARGVRTVSVGLWPMVRRKAVLERYAAL
eukprot:5628149-Prymnesium_polylepis.1